MACDNLETCILQYVTLVNAPRSSALVAAGCRSAERGIDCGSTGFVPNSMLVSRGFKRWEAQRLMRVKVWLKRKLLVCAFQPSASGYYSLLQMLHTGKMANSLGHRVSESYRSEYVHIEQISSMTVVYGTLLWTYLDTLVSGSLKQSWTCLRVLNTIPRET